MPISRFVLPVLTILFSVSFLYASLSIPPHTRSVGLGPAAWPRAILSSMFFLGVVLFAKELLAHKKEKSQKQATGEAGLTDSLKEQSGQVSYAHWFAFMVTCAYILSMTWLGFIPATFLYIIAMAVLLGMRRWGVIFMVSLTSTLLLGYVFMNLLMTPLPRGVGIFRDLNMFFTLL